MAEQITTYQCPACVGPLQYSAATGKLECEYCGSSFEVAEVEAFYAGKAAATAPKLTCPACKAELNCEGISGEATCPGCGAEFQMEDLRTYAAQMAEGMCFSWQYLDPSYISNGAPVWVNATDFSSVQKLTGRYVRIDPKQVGLILNEVIFKDADGNIVAIHCTYDPESKGGNAPDGRKVKGTIHWVSAEYGKKVTVRLYENIIDEDLGVYNEDGSLNLNPNSLTVLDNCIVEPALAEAKEFESFQFVRQGFFCADYKDSVEGAPVFNRIVSLKSSFKLPTNA